MFVIHSMLQIVEHRLFAIAAVLIAGVLTAAIIFASYAGLGWIKPLVTVDGTYQTFAMLNRLSNGQLPGQDFVPYLGVLLCYALIPVFWLLDQSIFAAFAAAQLMVEIAWFGTCVALLWATGFSRRNALALGALVYTVLFVLSFAGGFLTVAYRAGQSMMFLRDSAALLVVAAMLLPRNETLRRAVIAAASGVLLFWSPSAGAALLLTGTMVTAAGSVRDVGLRRGILHTVGLIGVALLAALLTATIVSGGAPLWLFEKVFLSAGQTQFWFFGRFSGADRLLRVSDAALLIAPSWREGIMLTGLIAASGYAWLRAGIGSRQADAIALICGSQFVSGLASQASGHIEFRYLHSFAASALVVLIGLMLPGLLKLRIARKVAVGGIALTGVAAAAAVPLVAVTDRGNKLYTALTAQLGSASQTQFAEAGMAFPANVRGEIAFLRNYRAALDRAGTPADRRMTSAYYSWADVTLGAAQSPQFSSIIQLMSDADRAYFINRFKSRAPQLVSTLDPAATPRALWNLRASWPFYQAALATHEPKWRGSSMIYWQRRAQPITPQTAGLPVCTIRRTSGRVVDLRIDGGAGGADPVLVDVAVTYAALPGKPGVNGDLGRGYLRVADRSPVLLAAIADLTAGGAALPEGLDAKPGVFYGLPAGQRQWAIPVEHKFGQISVLQLEVRGGSAASLDVAGCHVTGVWPNPLAALDRLTRLTSVVKQ